jgi:RNA polymerase sigma factor for flagellar operon FliA
MPNPSEVAEALGLSLEDYRKLLYDASAAILVSLDDALSSEHSESAVLSDLAADVAAPTSQERLEDREQRSIIVQCLKELPDQEKLVLALYYYEELTFKEIGGVLNLTESRVSQIHSKAVAVLRGQVSAALNR